MRILDFLMLTKPCISDMGRTRIMYWLLQNGGTAPRVMVSAFLDMECDVAEPPKDFYEFEKCYTLIEKDIPELKPWLFIMCNKGCAWSNIIRNWDILSDLYERATSQKNYTRSIQLTKKLENSLKELCS